jgi:hypothetical protein
MLRHIAWFNEAAVEPVSEGGLTSADPQVCQRCLAPAREMEKLGVECSVFGNLHNADPIHVGKHLQKLQTDIVVIGKISEPSLLKLARTAKHLGCYVVADFGNDTAVSREFEQLASFADQIVTATEEAADVLEQEGFSSFIIPDCAENGRAETAPDAVAHIWLDCFRKLKMKPPACANTNEPLAGNG